MTFVLRALMWVAAGLLSMPAANAQTNVSPSPATKIDNAFVTGPERTDALNEAFRQSVMWQARNGTCEVLSPNRAYVEEMLVDVETIGAPGGPEYERRVALVVGNSAYKNFSPLKNPSNDANSMSRVLRALGFTVYRGLDLTASELEECLTSFNRDLEREPADLSLFYYAGHGVQLTNADDGEGRNFMLATDADVMANGDGRGFKQIDAVLNEMRDYSDQSVFFYDACRNDPLGDDKPETADGLAIKRLALARPGAAEIDVKQTAASDKAGIFIAYASAPNRPADDAYEQGANHSPFTQALLNHIATPGYSLKQAMSYVSNDVGELTDWNQTPWQNSSLTKEVKLNGELDEDALSDKSATFAAEAQQKREEGLRGEAVADALKGMPTTWLDGDQAQLFASARVELFRTHAMRDAVLVGHIAAVNKTAFSPDGAYLVTASIDRSAKIWDVATGNTLKTFEHSSPVRSAAFSPDGKQLVTVVENGTVTIWNIRTGETSRILTNDGYSAFFSSDGRYIVIESEDRTAKIWDAQTGRLLRSFDGRGTANFSPDGKYLVTVAQWTKIWDVRTGELLNTLKGHGGAVYGAAFSPDSHRIVTASEDKTAKIWDVRTGELLITFEGHGDAVMTAAFSPEGTQVATGSYDNTAKIWDANTGEVIESFASFSSSPVVSVSFSPDGTRISAASDDRVMLRIIESGSSVKFFAGHSARVISASFSPDGKRLITGSADQSAIIWNVENGAALATLKGHYGPVIRTYFSFDGQKIITVAGGPDASAKIWDTNTGELLITIGRSAAGFLSDAKFSPDATFIVTAASSNGSVKIWDVKSGRLVKQLEQSSGGKYGISFNPDGSLVVAGSYNGNAYIWNVENGAVSKTLKNHNGVIFHAAFSPDGTHIVTASGDRTAKIWNAGTGEIVTTLRSHNHAVIDASFSSDGRRVLTAGRTTAKLWDAKTGENLTTLRGKTGRASFSPDGKEVVTGYSNQTARIWTAGLYGPKLLSAAYELLTPELRGEVERERIRYWELDEALLQ